MRKPLAILGAVAGSTLGWWLGSFIGIMTAFIVSMVGAGFGIYLGTRITRHYLL
jgi:hypothetical protein